MNNQVESMELKGSANWVQPWDKKLGQFEKFYITSVVIVPSIHTMNFSA